MSAAASRRGGRKAPRRHLAYAEAIARFPGAQSLDAERLFETPARVLAAPAAHFGIALPAGEADSIARGDVFTTYSKQPDLRFGNADRRALQASVADSVEPEIAQARAWIEALPARRLLPERLDRPLLGPSASLLES